MFIKYFALINCVSLYDIVMLIIINIFGIFTQSSNFYIFAVLETYVNDNKKIKNNQIKKPWQK